MRSFLERHQGLKDLLGILGFILAVIIGAALINQFLFRSFSVSGPSMEPTLYTGDRLIVNRVPVSFAQLQGKSYVPDRGQVIVFKNPHWMPGGLDE
jgi:signal peptidase I